MDQMTITRRGMVGAGCASLAFAATGLLSTRAGHAKMAPSSAIDAVDMHYHVETDAVRRLPNRRSEAERYPLWTAEDALAHMDRQGILASVISTRVIGVAPPRDEAGARAFARACNEDGAAIVRANPRRFRYFAYMPMPFVQATLDEIGHAFDTLGAIGIFINTSYSGKWLGHPDFTSVMAELNRRKAMVFTHPAVATCCAATVSGLAPAVIEYGTDTTRTIADLIFSGTASRFPDIRFIFSHAGGTAPFLFERLEREGHERPNLPEGVMTPFRRFYFDTAQAANPYALGTLVKLVPPTQILFGSDFPFRDPLEQLRAMDGMNLSPALLSAIRHGNARRLIPTLP